MRYRTSCVICDGGVGEQNLGIYGKYSAIFDEKKNMLGKVL